MTKALLLFFSCNMFFACLFAQDKKYTLNPERIDFGTIFYDTLKQYTQIRTEKKSVWLKNISNDTLVIATGYWGSDWCPLEYPREPILPNDSGKITTYCVRPPYPWKINKAVTLHTTAGTIIIPYSGEFLPMPHLTEWGETSFSFNNAHAIQAGTNTFVSFVIKNLSSSVMQVSCTSCDSLIEVDKKVLKVAGGGSVEVKLKLRGVMPEEMKTNYMFILQEAYFEIKIDEYREVLRAEIDAHIEKN